MVDSDSSRCSVTLLVHYNNVSVSGSGAAGPADELKVETFEFNKNEVKE
jgi:hypothetical protein